MVFLFTLLIYLLHPNGAVNTRAHVQYKKNGERRRKNQLFMSNLTLTWFEIMCQLQKSAYPKWDL